MRIHEVPLVFGTNNSLKIDEGKLTAKPFGFQLKGAGEVGFALDPDENGADIEEIVRGKANAYLPEFARHPIFSRGLMGAIFDDTEFRVPVLGNRPGRHVRRWKDGATRLSDDELCTHCLEQLAPFKGKQRLAVFRTMVAAVILMDGEVIMGGLQIFASALPGYVTTKEIGERAPDSPLGSIFFVKHWKKTLAQTYCLPDAERAKYPTHRTNALIGAFTWMQNHMTKHLGVEAPAAG